MAPKTKQHKKLTREEIEARYGEWLELEVGTRYLVWTVTHAFAGLLIGETQKYLILAEVTQVFETGDMTGKTDEEWARAEKLAPHRLHRIPHGCIIDVSDLT